MSTVTQKYLRDENGEIISPITSAKSVMIDRGDFASTVEEILPYTYRIKSGGKTTTSQIIFSGSMSDWLMVKARFSVKSDSITTGKAVYLRINDTNVSAEYGIDARRVNETWESYNRMGATSNIYLGDIAYGGYTSYIDFIIMNDGTAWHSIKAFIGTATDTKGQYSISAYTGEFKHTSANNITLMSLIAPQGIQADGILQIYK